ncbi:MAG: ribonuclease Z [Prevotellaceae bacterium]|jgi:ribonuclease Z|nr:ribonuclease Z [Prevotellaceae bacterium]
MTFSLTVLGSSSASPAKNRFPTAHVLNIHERFFLIDCGEGAQIQMKRFLNIKCLKFNHIFISHLHGDHVFGLFGLLSTLDLMGKTNTLHIYAYKDLEELLTVYRKHFGENMNYDIEFHPVEPYEHYTVYEDGNITVETIPLKHRVPTCGYLFREKMPPLNIYKDAIEKYNLSIADIEHIKKGHNFITAAGQEISNSEFTYVPYKARSYAFCSDTMYSETIIDIIKNVDLLYHEATFLDDMRDMAQQTGHSTTKQAAKIASKAQVRQLLVGHFSSRYNGNMLQQFTKEIQSVFQNANIVNEGETYVIPLIKDKNKNKNKSESAN